MKNIFILLTLILLTEVSFAENCTNNNKNPLPPSFESNNNVIHSNIPAFQTFGIDTDELQKKHEGTVTFAVAIPLNMDIFYRGIISELPCGQKSLMFRIQTPNAFSMNLHIDKIQNIPKNSKIWYYGGKYVDGKFRANMTGTSYTLWYYPDIRDAMNSNGEIWTTIVRDESFVLELLFPKDTSLSDIQKMSLRVERANAAFLDVLPVL